MIAPHHAFSKSSLLPLWLLSAMMSRRGAGVLAFAAPSTSPPASSLLSACSIVTGGNGYVGRAILHEIVNHHHQHQKQKQDDEAETVDRATVVVSLVRPGRVASETEYWDLHRATADDDGPTSCRVRVLPYDMLDGGLSLQRALEEAVALQEPRNDDDDVDDEADDGDEAPARRRIITLYHTAAVFGPTDNHRQTALDNVKGTEDLVRAFALHCHRGAAPDAAAEARGGQLRRPRCDGHLIVTSSMAAVRASGQVPANGKYYTRDDWNAGSRLGASWGESYQWSKAESEKRAWEMCRELDMCMTSLCPSFVFGPPVSRSSSEGDASSSSAALSGSYSLELVGEWVRGVSPVQSRLFVDVRDVALAHVMAAHRRRVSGGQRYVVSTEARVPSQDIADWLRDACQSTALGDPSLVKHDSTFAGGAIPIGEKEVEATDRLERELGVTLRPVKDTIVDMANILLREQRNEEVIACPSTTSKTS
jgi:nucleoside-diphosphate-sugar epimerase